MRKAQDSGYEFPRATSEQLQDALDVITRHDFQQTDNFEEEAVEWEEELKVEEML